MNERWYDKTVAQIEEKLNTDINTGLSPSVLRSRQKNDEMNVIFPIMHHSFESCLKKVASEPTTILLVIVAFLAALLENNISAWVIISLVAFNVIVSVFTYHKAQRIFEDMGKLSLPTTKVLRNGKMYLIKSEQLVKGDIIYLSAGDMVPADARLIEAENLQVLEVNITGAVKASEKDPTFLRYTHDVPPAHQANMVFASTIVIKGCAKAVCCCTGEDTLICKLEKNKPVAPNDNIRAISFMSKYSQVWSLVMIALIIFIVILMLFWGASNKTLFDIFLTALALAAASAGEFYTISSYIIVANGLFSAVKQNKQTNSGALVKNISKIENLKSISCLLVHKEGAFSIKDSRIEKIYVNNSLYTDGEVHFKENVSRVLRFALISTGIYGAGKIINNNLNNENIYTAEEDAIIAISQKCKVYNINLDKNYPILDHVSRGESSKFETTLVNSSSGYTVACRGDLYSILACCNSYCENGKIYPFDSNRKSDIISEATKLCRKSYKIIAVASKITHYNTLRRIISCQSDMVFEGFIAIRERMLPGAAKNIADCHAVGIKVIMLCDDMGDHNKALAESLGILKSGEERISGKELEYMKDELFRTNVPMYRLYEGLNIFQKRKLLSYLHSEGEVVGVLARELDEIILLKEADVGFVQSTTLSGKLDKNGIDMTMAKNTNAPMLIKKSKDSQKTGSEALKFIADVIVSDADKRGNGGFNALFSSIIASKLIYKNLIRFVKYLLTTQIARLLIVIYTIFTNTDIFSPQQILFSGLIIDLISMTIITFEQSDNVVVLKNDWSEELFKIYKYLPLSILSSIVWADAVAILPLILKALGTNSVQTQSTVVFIGFVLSQVLVLNEILKDNSIFKPATKYNRAHLIMIVTTVIFFVLALHLPSIGNLFGIYTLNWTSCLIVLIPSVVMIIAFEIQKAIINSK